MLNFRTKNDSLKHRRFFGLIPILVLIALPVKAQQGNPLQGYLQTDNQIQGLYRLVEPGQLADTLSLWGDVGMTGTVLAPRSMNLVQLISYAGGPGGAGAGGMRTIGRQINWSHEKVYVRIQRYNPIRKRFELKTFTFQDNHALPTAFQNYSLHNNDVISIQVRQKPSPLDYIQVLGITVGSVAAILLVTRTLGGL